MLLCVLSWIYFSLSLLCLRSKPFTACVVLPVISISTSVTTAAALEERKEALIYGGGFVWFCTLNHVQVLCVHVCARVCVCVSVCMCVVAVSQFLEI